MLRLVVVKPLCVLCHVEADREADKQRCVAICYHIYCCLTEDVL
jgi:hypothetical protein